MTYIFAQPNLTSGLDDAIVTTVSSVPSFIPSLLFFIFGTVFLGGILSQRRRQGTTDLPMWSTIASLCTLLVSLPLTLTAGLIQLEVLVIVVVVTIFSGGWLFLSRNRNEL